MPALDGLRGLAVLAVVAVHANLQMGGPHAGGTWAVVWGAGWVGVDLFFVLSGFLITGILLDASAQPDGYFRNFYARRTLRIFPLYYGVLAFGVLVVLPPSARTCPRSTRPSRHPFLL